MTSILPGKFDGSSDLATWLREFDACSLANDWKEEEKIKKLPAFLRRPATSQFYAIPADDRKTYKDTVKMLIGAMCPTAQRENFYAEFEARTLRPGEIQLCINGTSNKSCLKWTHSSMVKPRKLSFSASS